MVGRVLTRMSMDLLREIPSDPAILGQAPLGDIEPRHHLWRRAAKRFARFTGGVAISCSMPSIPKRIRYFVS